jgi:hypothetical protein
LRVWWLLARQTRWQDPNCQEGTAVARGYTIASEKAGYGPVAIFFAIGPLGAILTRLVPHFDRPQ